MDTRVLVAIILVAGVAGGFASNYVGDYYSDDSDDVEETQRMGCRRSAAAALPLSTFTAQHSTGKKLC